MNIIDRAKNFATKAHCGQIRKFHGLPYIGHPERVAALVQRYGGTYQMICAAWLHDTVEDCGVSIKTIQTKFGIEIAKLVQCLTNPSKNYPELPRVARKSLDNIYLSKVCDEAKLIKLCDRLDNVRDITKADKEWQQRYAKETVDLLQYIGDVSPELRKEILKVVDNILDEKSIQLC